MKKLLLCAALVLAGCSAGAPKYRVRFWHYGSSNPQEWRTHSIIRLHGFAEFRDAVTGRLVVVSGTVLIEESP